MKMLSLLAGLVTSIILARFLGPTSFGQYSFIMSLIMVLCLPLDQGMRQLITRETAKYQHEGNWSLLRGLFRSTQLWILFGILVIFSVVSVAAVVNADWRLDDRWTLLLLVLPAIPLFAYSAHRSAGLRGLGFVVQAQVPELLVGPLSLLLIFIALSLLNMLSTATALMTQVAAGLTGLIFANWLYKRNWPKNAQKCQPVYRHRDWLMAWIPFTLLTAASLLNTQIGILLLGWLGTNNEVAALRVADQGARVVSISLTIVNMVISPQITRAYHDGNMDRLQKLSRQSARAALMFALPVALPMIFFGDEVISLLFGGAYSELTVAPLAVLAAAQLFNVAFGPVGMFLVMSGFERDTLKGQVIALCVNAILAILLVPRLGAEGAAYASAAGIITWNLLLGIKFVQRLNLRPSAL
jgi:O-antigen/teichoic acid export membrane protein